MSRNKAPLRAERKQRRKSWLTALLGGAFIAGIGLLWFARSGPEWKAGRETAGVAIPPSSERVSAAGLPALPHGRLARPREAVEDAYLFAAQHPDVLKYVPCFCGCERNGHRSNHDCFVANRTQKGEVTWSAHGMG